MCGISGVIAFKGSTADPKSLKLMNDAIRHRGPDGDGFLFFRDEKPHTAFGDETPPAIRNCGTSFAPVQHLNDLKGGFNFGFGHRRLSIIDLGENGYQPLCNPDQTLWITYNGEIYNYIELKTALQAKGHSFHTRTDTEVILAAYREWGTDCVSRFNGMWSFVIYDTEKKLFFGSRDRFGVKPFYYYRDEGCFLFASEQKALLKHPVVKSGINPQAVADYFIAGEIEYSEQGMFSNITELFPSTSFTLDARTGQYRHWTYYQLHTTNAYEEFDQAKFIRYRDRCEDLLTEAVRLRLRADVPVGSCLSGGIDSSAIVGIIKALSGKNHTLETFTASFPQKEFDESHWAKMVADQAGARSHFSTPTRDELVADIENLVYSQDAPVWSTSTYAQYRVMKLVKDCGVKVIMDGQGGDELFGGYQPHYTWYLADHLKNMRFGQALRSVADYGSFPSSLRALGKDYLKFKSLHYLPRDLQNKINTGYFKDLDYLNPDLISAYTQKLKDKPRGQPGSLNEKLLSEFVNTRLKCYLKCEDRCSMWHSVESRSPFADDHPLIEYVFSIPGNYKIHNGTHKYLMRESVRKYIPAAVLARKDKMGYASPNNKWVSEMREQMRPYFTDHLSPYFRMDKLMKDYDSFFNIESKPENGRIFKFMLFAVWMKVFNLK